MDKGIKALKGKQRPVIESFVDKYMENFECEICSNGNVNSLQDYMYIEEVGICSTCETALVNVPSWASDPRTPN